MNKHSLFLFFIIGILCTSCIPTKDLIYLQEKDETASSNEQYVKSVPQKPYRVQVSDVLNITIKAIDPKAVQIFDTNIIVGANITDAANYFNGYSIDDHGNIRYPVLGTINVLGRTIEEIRIIIEERLLKEYFTAEAGIFVTVKLAGFRFVINGEIASPGSTTLYQDRVTILEAIANAGDITVTGDRKDIILMRRFPHGTETFHIDLTAASATSSPAFNLQPNDYIYVKPLKQKTWGTGKTGIESLTSIIAVLSLATTTYLLLRN